MKRTDDFFMNPDDWDMKLYMNKCDKGYKEMYYTAPYHWEVVNIEEMKTFSYTEGDTTLLEFDDREEFNRHMEKSNEWIKENVPKYNEMEARMKEVRND